MMFIWRIVYICIGVFSVTDFSAATQGLSNGAIGAEGVLDGNAVVGGVVNVESEPQETAYNSTVPCVFNVGTAATEEKVKNHDHNISYDDFPRRELLHLLNAIGLPSAPTPESWDDRSEKECKWFSAVNGEIQDLKSSYLTDVDVSDDKLHDGRGQLIMSKEIFDDPNLNSASNKLLATSKLYYLPIYQIPYEEIPTLGKPKTVFVLAKAFEFVKPGEYKTNKTCPGPIDASLPVVIPGRPCAAVKIKLTDHFYMPLLRAWGSNWLESLCVVEMSCEDYRRFKRLRRKYMPFEEYSRFTKSAPALGAGLGSKGGDWKSNCYKIKDLLLSLGYGFSREFRKLLEDRGTDITHDKNCGLISDDEDLFADPLPIAIFHDVEGKRKLLGVIDESILEYKTDKYRFGMYKDLSWVSVDEHKEARILDVSPGKNFTRFSIEFRDKDKDKDTAKTTLNEAFFLRHKPKFSPSFIPKPNEPGKQDAIKFPTPKGIAGSKYEYIYYLPERVEDIYSPHYFGVLWSQPTLYIPSDFRSSSETFENVRDFIYSMDDDGCEVFNTVGSSKLDPEHDDRLPPPQINWDVLSRLLDSYNAYKSRRLNAEQEDFDDLKTDTVLVLSKVFYETKQDDDPSGRRYYHYEPSASSFRIYEMTRDEYKALSYIRRANNKPGDAAPAVLLSPVRYPEIIDESELKPYGDSGNYYRNIITTVAPT